MTFHEQITNDALELYDKDALTRSKIEIIQRELLATDEKYDYTELDNKPSIPVVDGTLSVSGAAADAKATGDEIGSLKLDIGSLEKKSIPANIYRIAVFAEPATDNDGLSDYDHGRDSDYRSYYSDFDSLPDRIYQSWRKAF